MTFPKLNYNLTQEIVIFDFETESLNLHLARPWELAFAIYKAGNVSTPVVRYPFWEDLKVSKGAAKITGFSYEKYRDLATPAEDVFDEFEALIKNPKYLMGGHNILGFDSFVLRSYSKMMGKWQGWNLLINKMVDTMCISRMYHNETKPDPENFLASQMKELGRPPRGSKKSTLSAMAEEFGIEVDKTQLHQAKYDIQLNGQVLKELIRRVDF